RGPLPRRRRHRGRLGPRARARRGVAQDGRAAPRPRRGRAPRGGAVLVWLNGRFLPARDARVSALDRGLLHGDGVYDTWRTYGGVPFATAAHLRRLAAAARVLGLPAPGPARVWERRVRGLVARSGLTDAAVRLTVTRGTAGDALAPEHPGRPTLLLTARRLPAHLARRQREGVAVVLLPFPRDAGPPWGGLKLVGHPSAVAGRLVASRRGAAEGLYVTAGGEVTEATSANLFLVERGALVTPPRAAGILPGVTRALVIALARRAGPGVGGGGGGQGAPGRGCGDEAAEPALRRQAGGGAARRDGRREPAAPSARACQPDGPGCGRHHRRGHLRADRARRARQGRARPHPLLRG